MAEESQDHLINVPAQKAQGLLNEYHGEERKDIKADEDVSGYSSKSHKPLCWFRYVNDTFVIWPYGPGKLAEFLDHLNGVHENFKFNMET
jgi:hypothetical protein